MFKILGFIFLGLTCDMANAQNYTITSIENHQTRIHLNYRQFSKKLQVTCLNDTLNLYDYVGLIKCQAINEKYLKIEYFVRGGSDLILKKTAFICVFNRKIIPCLIINSFSEATSTDDTKTYKLTFSFSEQSVNGREMIVHLQEKFHSKPKPFTDYDSSHNYSLKFDSALNIFYSKHENIDQRFLVHNINTNKDYYLKINQSLPIVKLGKDNYYFYKGEWYERSDSDQLFKDSFKNS